MNICQVLDDILLMEISLRIYLTFEISVKTEGHLPAAHVGIPHIGIPHGSESVCNLV